MASQKNLRFFRDEWNHLTVEDASGKIFRDVHVVPLFPISSPAQLISIVSLDGEEIACFDSLEDLDSPSRQLLKEELAMREFSPVIEKIVSVSGTQEPCEWVVITNHGETSFVINSEEDVRRVSNHSVIITDANGIRFRVDDMHKLDRRSRSFVEWYI